MADLVEQLGHRRRIEPGAGAGQLDDVAVVVAVDDRLHPGPRGVGRRVDVGEQSDDRRLVVAIGCKRRGDVTVLVERRVIQSQLAQLRHE